MDFKRMHEEASSRYVNESFEERVIKFISFCCKDVMNGLSDEQAKLIIESCDVSKVDQNIVEIYPRGSYYEVCTATDIFVVNKGLGRYNKLREYVRESYGSDNSRMSKLYLRLDIMEYTAELVFQYEINLLEWKSKMDLSGLKKCKRQMEDSFNAITKLSGDCDEEEKFWDTSILCAKINLNDIIG